MASVYSQHIARESHAQSFGICVDDRVISYPLSSLIDFLFFLLLILPGGISLSLSLSDCLITDYFVWFLKDLFTFILHV